MSGVERIRLNQAVESEMAARLELGPVGNVECVECHAKEWVGGMFKCFFCLSYFCQTCGEKHFGMTREEYWKNKVQPHPATQEETKP